MNKEMRLVSNYVTFSYLCQLSICCKSPCSCYFIILKRLLCSKLNHIRTALLRIPWLVTHMIIIIITTISFICWTFITFFIDLLVTIVFPVLSGLILGVSILLWRLIYNIHNNYKTAGDELDVSDIKIGSK